MYCSAYSVGKINGNLRIFIVELNAFDSVTKKLDRQINAVCPPILIRIPKSNLKGKNAFCY